MNDMSGVLAVANKTSDNEAHIGYSKVVQTVEAVSFGVSVGIPYVLSVSIRMAFRVIVVKILVVGENNMRLRVFGVRIEKRRHKVGLIQEINEV